MTLPPKPRLIEMITSQSDLSMASLATRIFIGRLRIEARMNPALLEAKLTELVAFANANDFAAADLARI